MKAIILISQNIIRSNDTGKRFGNIFCVVLAALIADASMRELYRRFSEYRYATLMRSLLVGAENGSGPVGLHTSVGGVYARVYERVDPASRCALRTEMKTLREDMNRWFEATDRRFNSMQWLIGLGIAFLTILMSLYRFFQ